MSVTAWPAYFSRTVTGTWEVLVEGREMHVLWYQNRVGSIESKYGVESQVFEVVVRQALADAPWMEVCRGPMYVNNIAPEHVIQELQWRRAGKRARTLEQVRRVKGPGGGNCLIIPLLGHYDSIRLLDTSRAPDILSDIAGAVAMPESASRERLGAATMTMTKGSEMVFFQYDIYDIVIVDRGDAVAGALFRIGEDKRPAMNDEVFNSLSEWYQCPLAFCCFKHDDVGESKPLAFAFEPLNPHNIVIYTLDARNGLAPAIASNVLLDHTVFVGSYRTDPKKCARPEYSQRLSAELQPFVLEHAMGVPLSGLWRNGDISFSIADVRAGRFEGLRSAPPFAPVDDAAKRQTVNRTLPYTTRVNWS